MRTNVYAEELTGDTAVVTNEVTGEDGRVRKFYGVRFFLKSHQDLHHSADDDDRSAVTIWVPWTEEGGHNFMAVGQVLEGLRDRLIEAGHMEFSSVSGD